MGFNHWISKVILDVISLFLVFLPWLVIQTAVKPYRRGFFCDDESISHPYKDDTVTYAALTIAGFIVSFFVFALAEGIHFAVESRSNNPPPSFRMTSRCTIPRYFVMVYKIFGIFLFGLAVQQSITNIGKYSIGRLRPHFLDVCNPDFSTFDCTVANTSSKIMAYIEDDVCRTSEQTHKLKDARMSFPSGHSSFATYIAVFLTLYLQTRMTWKGSKLLKHFLQVVFIYLAIYVCLSRVSDYKHHWSDVLAGAILGVFVAALTGIHISSQFKDYYRRWLHGLPYHVNSSHTINQSEAAIA